MSRKVKGYAREWLATVVVIFVLMCPADFSNVCVVLLLLVLKFIKRHISGTSPFIGMYIHAIIIINLIFCVVKKYILKIKNIDMQYFLIIRIASRKSPHKLYPTV